MVFLRLKKLLAVTGLFILLSVAFTSLLRATSSTNNEDVQPWPPVGKLHVEEYLQPLRRNLISDKYTVLMPTYRRDDVLEVALRFHCGCRHVHRIVVVWNNVHEDVPRSLRHFPCTVKIYFIRQRINSLNNRFKAYQYIKTEGVLVMDDDRTQLEQDIELAFESWKRFRKLIVGFQAYMHGYNESTKRYYLEDRFDHRPSLEHNRTTYSIILTTSFFINIFYLKLYSESIPIRAREFINTKFNGEDIAMNFLVSQYLYETDHAQPGCLWVQGTTIHHEWSARRFRGINHVLKNFHEERNELLNLLVKEYGRMSLQYSNTVVYSK